MMEMGHQLWYSFDIFSVLSAYYFTICHPTYCSANHNTFFRANSKSAGLVNADSHKVDAILCEPCSYTAALLLSQNGLSEQLISKNFWEDRPSPPPSLACIYIYTLDGHPCNLPSTILVLRAWCTFTTIIHSLLSLLINLLTVHRVLEHKIWHTFPVS